jgi:hypothetical protein
MRIVYALTLCLLLSSCASYNYPSQVKEGEPLLSFVGASLDGTEYTIPEQMAGKPAVLLFGYVHKSQFDIDRWLIGLDMKNIRIPIYEIPAIQGFFPRLFSTRFDDAMREGIPREIWSDVITVYKDGDRVQRFTGNESPKNSRVIILDEQGRVVHFYDRGFSVAALNALVEKVRSIEVINE